MSALTPKRGKKAPPIKRAVGRPNVFRRDPEPSHTKRGPGRRAYASANAKAPRTAPMPPPEKKLRANVGQGSWRGEGRRIWREGEPLHILKPVRVARLAKAKKESRP